MRKAALKAMVILAVVVALCMFFSGTIRTITTPRVRFTSAKQGKFESTTELSGTVVFTEVEEFTVDLPEDITLTITGVFAKPGAKLKEGDRLFTAVVADYDKTSAAIRSDYASAEASLRELRRKNGALRLTKNEQAWADAYEALEAASDARRDQRVEVMTLLSMEGLLPESRQIPDDPPEGASEALLKAYEALLKAEDDFSRCDAALEDLQRYAIDETTWENLKKEREQQDKMAQCEDRLATLNLTARSVSEIRAPHDGYVSEVLVEKRGSASADTVLLRMTPEGGKPVIRLDVTSITQPVAEGTVVSVPSPRYGKAETTVTSLSMGTAGEKYADAAINSDVVDALGSVSAMMQGSVTVNLVVKSRESTTLINAAAVRGSGDERYIYYAEKESSTFGGTQLKVRKLPITVLNESSTVVSVSDDISRLQIIYMEDRALSEGDTVMAYEE